MHKENGMRTGMAITVLGIIALLAGATSGQNLEQKELAFTQVAVGPTLETVICVTNRGDAEYRGTMHFWKGEDQDWNPFVNGQAISGSSVEIRLGPGETRVFRVTGDSLADGAVVIVSEDSSLHSFLEGNLSYFIDDRNYDSVGIAPSKGLYRTVVPFEDSATVGLAMANPDLERPALVSLRLLDEGGRELETVSRILRQRSHDAQFLSEIFDAVNTSGKVEMDSSLPILGTAVTLVRGEISALPMLPSPVRYAFDSDSGFEADHAELVLWAEGVFVKGYLRFLVVDTKPIDEPVNYMVTGTLVDGVLRMTQMGAGGANGGVEPVSALRLVGFSFEGERWSGTYTRSVHGFPFDYTIEGSFELTRVD